MTLNAEDIFNRPDELQQIVVQSRRVRRRWRGEGAVGAGAAARAQELVAPLTVAAPTRTAPRDTAPGAYHRR